MSQGQLRRKGTWACVLYTVVPDDDNGTVVQFRAADDAFNLDLLMSVEQAYGRFVPRHQRASNLGELHVYTMTNIGGVSVYLARDQLRAHRGHFLATTLQGFAE